MFRPNFQVTEPVSCILLTLQEFDSVKLKRFNTTPDSLYQGWIDTFLMCLPKRPNSSVLNKLRQTSSIEIDANM